MDRDTQQELLGFSFADTWFLALLPVVLGVWLFMLRRRRPAVGVASVLAFDSLPRTWRVRLAGLPMHMGGLALLCLVLAAARPQVLDRVPVASEGIDIMLVLDLSSSMSSEDMDESGEKTRLDVAKAVAQDFLDRRPSDRIGLVSFALYPDLVCPATLDHEALERFLRPLVHKDQRSPENKTGLGAGLALAVKHLEESESASRVAILLTDGMENVNYVLPEDAAKLAKDAGVRVYTIGAGGHGGRDLLGRIVRPDFSMLREIAEKTEGAFFEATSADALGEVFAQIDELEKTELEDPLYRADERFLPFLLLGIALLGGASLLRATFMVEAP